MTKTKMILRNDPAKQRKKLGKIKDILGDDGFLYEYDVYKGIVSKYSNKLAKS